MAKKKSSRKKARNQREIDNRRDWHALLQCITVIAQMDPWDMLAEDDTCACLTADGSQMIFFSCVEGDEQGLIIFPSVREYQRASVEPGSTAEELRNFIESENYTVFFTFQDDVPPETRKFYERLSVDFGEGLWPWIFHKRRGDLGALLAKEDARFMLDCLGNFCMMLKALQKFDRKPDAAAGEMLVRYYSEKDNLWLNRIAPASLLPEPEYPRYVAKENSPAFRHLKEPPVSADHPKMEFDFGWVTAPGQDAPDFRLLAVVTDRETGEVLNYYDCRPDDAPECIFLTVAEAWEEYGLPRTLYICRDDSESYFIDLVQHLDLKLKRVKRLPAAARFLREMDAI